MALSRLHYIFDEQSPDGRKYVNFPCRLSVSPTNGPDVLGIGNNYYGQRPSESGRVISTMLRLRDEKNYNFFVDVKFLFHSDVGSGHNHSSIIVIRLGCDSLADCVGRPMKARFFEVRSDNAPVVSSLFSLSAQTLASKMGAVERNRQKLFVMSVPYSAFPPSANLYTRAESHGPHQETSERLRLAFASSGFIHALFCRPESPAALIDMINTRMQEIREKDPLAPFFVNLPQNQRYVYLGNETPKSMRPKITLPPQIIFSAFDQYMTTLGYGLVEEQEFLNARMQQITTVKIRLVEVHGSENRQYFGVLEYAAGSTDGNGLHIIPLKRDDCLKVVLRHVPSSYLNFIENDGWDAVVLTPLPYALPGTISIFLSRPHDKSTERRNETRIPEAIPSTDFNAASTAAARTLIANATPVRAAVQVRVGDGLTKLMLHASKVLATDVQVAWTQGCLLGRNIHEMPLFDMYRGVEEDALMDQAMQLAMFQLDAEQSNVLSTVRALPNGIGLIHGPPGTGKTELITKMLLPTLYTDARLGKNGERDGPAALLLSTTHQSAKEIATRLGLMCRKASEKLSIQDTMCVTRVNSTDSESVLAEFSQFFTTFQEKAASASVGDDEENVKIVNVTLGECMMLMSGFATTALAQRDQERFSQFRRLFLLYQTGKLGEADAKMFYQLEEGLREAALRRADVVITTVIGAASPRLRTAIHPTVIIVDDAARAKEPEMWPLFAWYPRGIKLLVGDAQQLGPHGRHDGGFSHQLRISLFTRLSLLGYPLVSLKQQYRAIRHNVKVFSTIFYRDLLKTSGQVQSNLRPRAETYEEAVKSAYNLGNGSASGPRILDVQYSEDMRIEGSGSYVNIGHVRVAMDAVKRLTLHGIDAHRIAVLVPYHAQLAAYNYARTILAETDPALAGLHLETFSAVQSREFDITIVDFVRTSGAGFLRDKGLVNVAISRARLGNIMIINMTAVSKHKAIFRNTPVWQIREFFNGRQQSVIKFSANAENSLVAIPGLHDFKANLGSHNESDEESVWPEDLYDVPY